MDYNKDLDFIKEQRKELLIAQLSLLSSKEREAIFSTFKNTTKTREHEQLSNEELEFMTKIFKEN